MVDTTMREPISLRSEVLYSSVWYALKVCAFDDYHVSDGGFVPIGALPVHGRRGYSLEACADAMSTLLTHK